jgi:RNA polymerase sigma-70 factor (ECF subfamily)
VTLRGYFLWLSADQKLSKRILDVDQRSFDVFFQQYYPRLYRFALARLDRDRGLADETAQVVLCQALDKLHTYRGEAPMFSWLCTFCRYEVSKQRKARQRAQGDQEMTEDDPTVKAALDSLLAASASDPDVELYQLEIERLVQVAMDQLPSLYADVLEAKYIRDLSVVEIASQLDKSPKATESILTRARGAFREAFRALTETESSPGAGKLASLLEY